MEIEVKGHSGCQIEILNDGGTLYIQKSTFDKAYIPRLALQAQKQQTASLNSYQHIRIPSIYNISQTDDHLTIKMEYVYSKNFIDYFEDAGFDQINYFIHALKIFIDDEIQKSPLKLISKNIILDKFKDVCHKISNNINIKDDEEVLNILTQSTPIFNKLDDYIMMPIGSCHGDLTFSNILFNGNNYYLIDFLDSFIESPLLDLIKIRQDSAYGWSQLMYKQSFDSVRMKIISEKIDKEINAYYSQYTWYRQYYKTFQLMNMLRVLQYAKEEKVITFLKHVLKSLL